LTLSDRSFGQPSFAWLVNRTVRDHSFEVAMAAASLIQKEGIAIARPMKGIHPNAARILRELGIIQRARLEPCGIHVYFKRLVGRTPEIRWRALFGPNHRQAESQAILCRACAETNITAWVNAMDVFDDLLLSALYGQDVSLGAYSALGSVIDSKRLAHNYPNVQAMAKSVHEKRYASALSHARERRTGRPTETIKFAYLKTAKPLVRAAILELATKWG
jgi:hypothetical protein